MINLISIIFSVCGFYLVSLAILFRCCSSIVKKEVLLSKEEEAYFFLFLSFLAWSVSSGLMALPLVWGYFINSSLLFRYSLNGAIGFVLLAIGLPVLRNYRGMMVLFSHVKLERKEKFILGFIVILLLIYLYRVTLPWADNDEVEIYGYLSKLIAGGRTFGDIFREGGLFGYVTSYLVQSRDALFYGLVNDTYLVRLIRLINLLFCGLGIFSFLRLIRVGRFWSLVAFAGFLSTPELAYLALSLKVDSVVMMFALAAFLSVLLGLAVYLQKKSLQWVSVLAICFSSVALLLAAFAFGNRFYEISTMILCAVCVWFFLTKQTKRPFVSLIGVLALSIILMFIACPGVLYNLFIYNNPIYPVKPPLFFQNASYTMISTQLKTECNIVGLPPVILQIYLIFALGVGLELAVKVLPFLSHLPMAVLKTSSSLGWPYPLIFSIFFLPFFIKYKKVLIFIALIFIFQLFFWSLTLHFGRLFIATNVLTILIAVIIADCNLPIQDRLRLNLQKVLRYWIIFSLAFSFIFQCWWFAKRYYGIFLFGADKRYKAKIGFLKTKTYMEQNELTLRETLMLNGFFKRENKPIVYVFTYSRGAVHILFDKHIHIKELSIGDPFSGGGRYLLINPDYLKNTKIVNRDILLRYFPIHVLTTPETKWELYRSS
jgi:hypothetical protein